ncbi:MAG: NusG domain II-containing protein [Gammaproteobacteria bacterium]|nr:NusG domain II-containing protein [Gammaproteobacteria bacterium]
MKATLTLFTLFDIFILISVCFLTLWLYSLFWFNDTQSGKASAVIVQFANQTPVEYQLNKNQIIRIEGQLGETLIEIKQGKARFIHSSCRNQLCVFHGWLSDAGATTACLPNQVSITLTGAIKEFDAIAGAQ